MRTLALLAVVSPLLAPVPAAGVTVWTALANEKLRPSAAARPAASSAHVSAARNEFEPVQIAVTGAATNVRATATPLTGPGGATVPAPRLYREVIITLAYASGADGATGPWP